MGKRFKILPLFFLLWVAGSCSSENTTVGEASETIDVPALETYASECADAAAATIDAGAVNEQETNASQSFLDCRVRYENRALELDGSNSQAALEGPSSSDLSLRLLATISPPVIEGTHLGATDVYSIGDRAVVTYNTPGADYFGALQIVDIHNPLRPRLISESVFVTTDLSASWLEGSTLYLAGARDVTTTGFDDPAEIFAADLDSSLIPLGFSDPAPLPSFVGTDLAVHNGSLYATTGDAGGLVKLNTSSLAMENFLDLEDARSLVYDDDRLYVFQGTPGRLTAVDPDTFASETFSVGGATIPESKSTIEADEHLLFIGAGDGGALIVSPEDGSVLATIANPNDPALDDSLEVANAVTVNDHLVFVSNGQAGIRLVSWEERNDDIQTQVLGTLNLGENISANDIAYRDDYLMVAAGTAGLKIVKVIRSPYVASSPCESVTALFCDDFNQVDGFKINDNEIWEGNSSQAVATVIGAGGRINKNKSITTFSSFDPTTVGKHHSIKLLKSTIFTVHWEKDKNIGIQIRYDGATGVTAYIGKVNNATKRKTVNFTLPGGASFVVAHVYQQGTTIKITLELQDGTTLTSGLITTTEPQLLDPQAVRIEPFSNADQPVNAPSFDNVLVEDFSF